jgi:hypothetical protein
MGRYEPLATFTKGTEVANCGTKRVMDITKIAILRPIHEKRQAIHLAKSDKILYLGQTKLYLNEKHVTSLGLCSLFRH